MSQTRQRSLLPLFGLTAPQAFQAALQGTRATPRTVMTGGRPRLVGADVPAAPLRPTPITRADMPLGRAALSPLAMGASAPLPQDPTMLQRLQADKPFSAGLQAAGEALAQASGYTEQPKDTLSMINQAMAAFNQAQRQQAMMEAQTALSKQQREQELALEREKMAQAMDIAEMQYGSMSEKEKLKRDLEITKLRKSLREEFNDTSKPFTEGKKFWVDVVNYSKPEQSSAADLALVFSFMKMLDPESVVREGEQLQVRGLGGLGAEARSLLSKLGISQEGNYEGGLLIIDPAVRAQIRQVAADKFAEISTEQYAREKFTIEEGSRAGLTPDFFRSKIVGSGTMKRPYIVSSIDELPDTAKAGEYAVINGVFSTIEEQS